MEQMSVMINNHLLNIKWSVKRKGTRKWGMGKTWWQHNRGEGCTGEGDRDIVHFVVTSVKPFSTHFPCFSLCLEPSVAVITASNPDLIITSVSNWTMDNGNFHYPQTLWRTIIFVSKSFLLSKYDLKNTEIVIR